MRRARLTFTPAFARVLVLGLILSGLGAALAGPPEPPRRLSRLEALRAAASRNLTLMVQRMEVRRATLLARAAWRPLSPALVMDTQYRRLNELETDRFRRLEVLGYSAGLQWTSLLGTTLTARLHANDGTAGPPLSASSGSGSNPGEPGAPLNDLAASLTLAQPLLRGGWCPGAALGVREAELTERVQRELFREELNALLVAAETAYWDLAVAEVDLDIKTRSRDRATQQYEDTAENIRRGILAPGEIHVVEENVVFFEQELLRARQALVVARRRTAELLQLSPEVVVSASDPLDPPELSPPARDGAIAESLRASPAVLAQRLRWERASARLSTAANAALPALDLEASVGTLAWATDLSSSWRRSVSAPLVSGRVGLSLEVPLDRGAIRADLEAAGVETAREDAALREQESRVRQLVDEQLAELSTSLSLVALARRRVELAELKLAVETEKYKNGVSTLVDVVRFQRDLDEVLIAFRRQIRAVHVGHARLLATRGTLHESVGVEVE